jgi:hypothetical protein
LGAEHEVNGPPLTGLLARESNTAPIAGWNIPPSRRGAVARLGRSGLATKHTATISVIGSTFALNRVTNNPHKRNKGPGGTLCDIHWEQVQQLANGAAVLGPIVGKT